MAHSALQPNMTYAHLASAEQIERTVEALQKNNIQTYVANSGADAREQLFKILPPGAEVFTGSSRTLDTLGIPAEVDKRYNSIRVKLAALNPQTQGREMIKIGAVPEYILGSVHAVTEDGTVVVASATGSQLAPYAASAAHVIWIVGTQKIVPNMDEAMKRIQEYTFPLEDERALSTYGANSSLNKILIIYRETQSQPGRTTMILVKENLGF